MFLRMWKFSSGTEVVWDLWGTSYFETGTYLCVPLFHGYVGCIPNWEDRMEEQIDVQGGKEDIDQSGHLCYPGLCNAGSLVT